MTRRAVNASGVGASGDQYRVIQVGNVETNSSGPTSQGASEGTATDNVEYVSQGSSPNFAVEQTVHVTYNANGELTAYVVNTTSDPCRG